MPTYLNFSRVFLTCKNIAIRMDGLEVRPALTTSSGKASLQRVRHGPKSRLWLPLSQMFTKTNGFNCPNKRI